MLTGGGGCYLTAGTCSLLRTTRQAATTGSRKYGGLR
jgi:hypothetical protein